MYESRAKHRNWEQHAHIIGETPEHERIRIARQGLSRLGQYLATSEMRFMHAHDHYHAA